MTTAKHPTTKKRPTTKKPLALNKDTLRDLRPRSEDVIGGLANLSDKACTGRVSGCIV